MQTRARNGVTVEPPQAISDAGSIYRPRRKGYARTVRGLGRDARLQRVAGARTWEALIVGPQGWAVAGYSADVAECVTMLRQSAARLDAHK